MCRSMGSQFHVRINYNESHFQQSYLNGVAHFYPWKENDKVLPVDQQKLRLQYFNLAKTKKRGANKINFNRLRPISRALRYKRSCLKLLYPETR